MSTARFRGSIERIRGRWKGLDQDWQSVVLGATIVGLTTTSGIQIPW